MHDVGNRRDDAAVRSQCLRSAVNIRTGFRTCSSNCTATMAVELHAVERRCRSNVSGSPTITRSEKLTEPAGASCRVSTTETRHPALENDPRQRPRIAADHQHAGMRAHQLQQRRFDGVAPGSVVMRRAGHRLPQGSVAAFRQSAPIAARPAARPAAGRWCWCRRVRQLPPSTPASAAPSFRATSSYGPYPPSPSARRRSLLHASSIRRIPSAVV